MSISSQATSLSKHKMLLETDLMPFQISSPPGERIIVFAPHPDDETLGMGGSLRILADEGKKIKVIVMTNGEKADPHVKDKNNYISKRRKEALNAFRVLGITDHEFLGFRDRELFENLERVRETVRLIMNDFRPDALYSPSPIELNPDHRSAASLSFAFKKERQDIRCFFYEIVTPIRPNILVDISKVFKYKKNAMKCYKSQLRITDYLYLITSLNAYRSFTLGKGVKFAEAFWEIREAETTAEQIKMWLGYEKPLIQ